MRDNSDMRKIASFIFVLLLTGCASDTVLLYVHTQPPGAYVTETATGMALGASPAVANYSRASLKGHKDKTGCSIVKGFRAQWVSGATATTDDLIRLCGSSDSYNITIPRSPSDPGLEKDLEFSMRMQTANAAQRQAAAAEAAAAIQLMGVMQQSAPVNCTTMPIGKTIQTNCR